MLDSKAAVAAIGSLKKMPVFSDIEIGLLDKDVSLADRNLILIIIFQGALPSKRKFNIFR